MAQQQAALRIIDLCEYLKYNTIREKDGEIFIPTKAIHGVCKELKECLWQYKLNKEAIELIKKIVDREEIWMSAKCLDELGQLIEKLRTLGLFEPLFR